MAYNETPMKGPTMFDNVKNFISNNSLAITAGTVVLASTTIMMIIEERRETRDIQDYLEQVKIAAALRKAPDYWSDVRNDAN